MKTRFIASVLALLAFPAFGQNRFQEGELKGLTISRDEHIMNEVREPFIVRSVEGNVSLNDHDDMLPGVLIEIRGPGEELTILSAITDKNGHFRIKNVQPGKYMFKTTLAGFQSEYGHITVSKQAPKGNRIQLALHVGV